MLRKEPRVLFFHNSVNVTPEEQDAAMAITSNVAFRNAAVFNNGSTEECDAVAGDPPEEYLNKYPLITTHEEAIAAREGLLTVENQNAVAVEDGDEGVTVTPTTPKPQTAKAPAAKGKQRTTPKAAPADKNQPKAPAKPPKWGPN